MFIVHFFFCTILFFNTYFVAALSLLCFCSYRQLGPSDLVVSEVCLGTMTWGQQNSEADAAEQLDMAYDFYGINFVVSQVLFEVST